MALNSNVLVDFHSCLNVKVNDLIARNARRRNLPAKTIFVRPGDLVDSIYYIQKGRTRHYMVNSDGSEKVSYILNDGWFLREGAFLRPESPSFAERFSITEIATTFYIIDKPCYDRLIRDPDFSQELLRSSSTKNLLLRREMESMVFDTAAERVLKLLAVSANLSETVDQNWHRLKIAYTHQELAAIIGVNRVTVSRLMASFSRTGELRMVNQRIQIRKDVVARLLQSESDC